MFQETLREIVDKTEGGVAGLIMDSEGIAVDSYTRGDAPFDITTIGIEFGVVLGSIKRAAESLEAGKTSEVAIGTDKMITIIRTLGESYFLAVAKSSLRERFVDGHDIRMQLLRGVATHPRYATVAKRPMPRSSRQADN